MMSREIECRWLLADDGQIRMSFHEGLDGWQPKALSLPIHDVTQRSGCVANDVEPDFVLSNDLRITRIR
jgi:hypothetical protein